MFARIIILILLALVSFGANADVNLSAFEELNAKIDCIVKNGGFESRHAKEACIDKKAVSSKEGSSSKIISDGRKRDSKGLWHYKKVGGNPAKAAYKALARQPHAELPIGKKIHDDLIVMDLTPDQMDKIFYPVFNHTQYLLGLLKGKDLEDHQEKWVKMARDGSRYADFIRKGDVLQYLNFRTGVVKDVVVDFDNPEPAFIFPLGGGKELVWIINCWNFAIRGGEELRPPVPPDIPKPPAKPPTSERPPSISPDIEENVERVKVTVGGWAGIHDASVWSGHFEGGKATVTIPVHTALGLKDEQLWVGLGIRGEEWHGRSKSSDYRGDGSRFVPVMFVADWNGRGGLWGDTHAGSFNVGVGGNWMHGNDPTTGYFKDQYGKEVHVRLEQCERSGKWITCLYAEGNGAFGKVRMTSSWSGDTPEKTSSLMVGGSVEYLITDHWSVKGVLEGSINDRSAHAKLAVTAALEACYRDHWEGGEDFAIACFGPYVRIGEYDGFTYGGTANVFAGKIFSERVKAEKVRAVSFPEPHLSSPFIQQSPSDGGQEGVKMQIKQ